MTNKLSELSYLKIKKHWPEISISDYDKLLAIKDDILLNDLEKRFKTLALLSGKDDKYFNSFPFSESKALYESLTFLNEPITADLLDYYQIGERKYKLIKQISEMSYGMFIYLKEFSKDQQSNTDNIHKILSTVLIPVRPLTFKDKVNNKIMQLLPKRAAKWLNMAYREGVTEEYFETSLEETASNIYDHFDIASALTISLFFFLLHRAFVLHTLTYLKQEANKKLELALTTLKENPEKVEEVMKIHKAMDSLKILDT